MRIGALAQAAGIRTDTVRYYERCGLLAAPKRTANGYREYPDGALARLRLIRAAAAVGFSLQELRKILVRRDAGGVPCGEVAQIARAKAVALRAEERALRVARRRLETLVGEWEKRLSRGQRGDRLRFLEALAGAVELPLANPKGMKGKPS